MKSAELKLKPAKCKLLQAQVRHLKHIFSKDDLATDPGKVEAVRDWPTPPTLDSFKHFRDGRPLPSIHAEVPVIKQKRN